MKRTDILWWAEHGWPKEGVPYSQSKLWSDGYRQDCSGYVSMCLRISPNGPGCWGGFNTASAVSHGYIYEIEINSLRPGDMVGRCGPGSEGDAGHIQLFKGWDNNISDDNGHWVYEQTGGGRGWHLRHYADWHSGYKAYRFRDVEEVAPAPPPPPSPQSGVPQGNSFPLNPSPPHVFGLKTDPSDFVHGGFNGWEVVWIERLQRRLKDLGIYVGAVDGDYGRMTFNAVWEFQKRKRLTVDGKVGPQTWRALFA